MKLMESIQPLPKPVRWYFFQRRSVSKMFRKWSGSLDNDLYFYLFIYLSIFFFWNDQRLTRSIADKLFIWCCVNQTDQPTFLLNETWLFSWMKYQVFHVSLQCKRGVVKVPLNHTEKFRFRWREWVINETTDHIHSKALFEKEYRGSFKYI